MSLMEQVTADRAPAGATPKQDARQNPHGEAWGALTRTHAAIVQRLQETLSAADFPPLPWYEVLAAISEAPDQRMKMGDLAEALVITRGGLTKLVDRLVKAGLLERTFCETDRRVSYATLTPAGRRDAPGRDRRARGRLLGQPQRRPGKRAAQDARQRPRLGLRHLKLPVRLLLSTGA
jgi:DNA-binding MarR family transcriptional regulator